MSNDLSKATIGGGCFWCLEAIYLKVRGVEIVQSGYSAGKNPNPAYREVCGGQTGHAEVIQVSFDSKIISFENILEIFWKIHDPTTLNRQGNDSGTQYRSIILYHDDEQRKISELSKQEAQKNFSSPIVTEIVPLEKFYVAEDYHQNYLELNPENSYCQYVVIPKLAKFLKTSEEFVKS